MNVMSCSSKRDMRAGADYLKTGKAKAKRGHTKYRRMLRQKVKAAVTIFS